MSTLRALEGFKNDFETVEIFLKREVIPVHPLMTSRTPPHIWLGKHSGILHFMHQNIAISRIFSSLSSSHHLPHHRIAAPTALTAPTAPAAFTAPTALRIINHLPSAEACHQIEKQATAFGPLRIRRLDECLCRKMIEKCGELRDILVHKMQNLRVLP